MVDRSETSILRTEHLGRTVDGHVLVKDVSIEVLRGNVLAIVGPSGSGKSSFLRMLNRLDEPTSGEVYLDGQNTRQMSPRQLRKRVGMVMQSANLFPGTVADNIRYGPAQRGETVSDEDLEALLQEVSLGGYGSRDVSNLSGGEAQRVSLARTLANKPEVLLLDEPTSALDDAAEEEVEALLQRVMAQEDLTCLIVTHDMDQAASLAKRVMVMEKGRVAAIGNTEEVLNAESVV
jgi:putative ABC transport system ATP-binding protein